MKQLIIFAAAMLAGLSSFAQTDSAAITGDTLHAGNFLIIKKKGHRNDGDLPVNSRRFYLEGRHRSRPSNVSTNWLVFDLGFANIRDNTNYAAAASSDYFRNIGPGGPVTQTAFNLRASKSSNVNIWLFMQRVNIASHVLNLKYGLGLEMYNLRYESSLSYKDNPQPYLFMDSIGFSKNKLYAGYLTVPLMLNVNTAPGRRGFGFSIGASAGYLVGSLNKQISDQRGKQKEHGSFNLDPWRLAAVAELKLGPLHLFGTYSLNSLYKKDRPGLEQYPYGFGIRFSRW